MDITNLIPINTVFSVDSVLNIKELIDAKVLMNTEYGNRYSHIPPHLAFTIMPFPEKNLSKGIADLETYISKQKKFEIEFSDLIFDEKSNFFYVKIGGDDVKKHHQDITTMLNNYRENHAREKDLERIKEGKYTEKEIENIINYGFPNVFEQFRSHITIGNYTIENVNIEELTNKLRNILNPILNKSIVIDNIHGVFHTDSTHQSEMKAMWDKVYQMD